MDTTKCALGAVPGKYRVCNQADCPNCGWNAEVAAQRRECIQQNGMTLCADGKRRLILAPKQTGKSGDYLPRDDGRDVPMSPYPDGDESILACPYCGSGEYLHNADEAENAFCGQCGQSIKWTKNAAPGTSTPEDG